MLQELIPPGPTAASKTDNLTAFTKDPLGFLTHCAREYGDVVRIRFGPAYITFVNRPELIQQILVTRRQNYIKSRGLQWTRRVLGGGLLTNDSNSWPHHRRLLQPSFHQAESASHSQTMVALTDRLLRTWRDGETRDIHREMSSLTLQIAAKALFDTDVSDSAEAIADAVQVAIHQFDHRAKELVGIPTPGEQRFEEAAHLLDSVVDQILHQEGSQGGILQVLRQAQQNGAPLSEKQIRDQVITLFLAGYETPSNALSWTLYLLSQHPDVEAALHAELHSVLGGRLPTARDLSQLSYTEAVIQESMRLYPPAWGLARQAVEDDRLDGFPVKAGSTLLMSQWVMHRDPRFYHQPEQFQPRRWLGAEARRLPTYAYFPFGAGPRICIGQTFAQVELVLVLATIAQRFRLTLPTDFRPDPLPSISLRPKGGMPMHLKARA